MLSTEDIKSALILANTITELLRKDQKIPKSPIASAPTSMGVTLAEVKADADIASAISLKHGGPVQDTAIAGKTTILDTISKTNQNADIAQTAFVGANVAGLYRVSAYMEVTVPDATAGSIYLTIVWTDDWSSTNTSFNIMSMASGNRTRQHSVFRLASGTLDYRVTHTGNYNNAKYAIFLCCERLI